ncbi:hypothetical protein M427DRAFT_189048 [Gonapodya prolifera JEL478]|uniref:Uncharacterized protein n=1 Tax=Gonapodya prolifera (strain JEL478) TaxID=1344416 RepID=A0A139A0A4_GONPJ|nr:hypothetical protein M427DRAFT_189048 [Gonapodya prolifera JEL478]|eukprot:KXS10162.1 hypothetical protein M427DRAFT_189048 [Gonapodya prolifera JEL478]
MNPALPRPAALRVSPVYRTAAGDANLRLDNARFHRATKAWVENNIPIALTADTVGVKIHYTSPYCPFLNPVEHAFKVNKNDRAEEGKAPPRDRSDCGHLEGHRRPQRGQALRVSEPWRKRDCGEGLIVVLVPRRCVVRGHAVKPYHSVPSSSPRPRARSGSARPSAIKSDFPDLHLMITCIQLN